jgi:hypothetical protein
MSCKRQRLLRCIRVITIAGVGREKRLMITAIIERKIAIVIVIERAAK